MGMSDSSDGSPRNVLKLVAKPLHRSVEPLERRKKDVTLFDVSCHTYSLKTPGGADQSVPKLSRATRER